MRVKLYPELTFAELGAIRFELSTEIVKPDAMGKHEIDFDNDIRIVHWAFPTEEQAREYAAKVLDRDDLAFGAVTLQKQVVDWFVREDRVAEWSDAGESEEITK